MLLQMSCFLSCKRHTQRTPLVGLYVRLFNAAPEPAVVCATVQQLLDLARFCTAAFEFCPLTVTVDPTFCLGEFDVILITHRHLFL